MAEVVRYNGQIGLPAVLEALENVRVMLDTSEITPKQAVSFLACIDLHLAQMVGMQGEFVTDLVECGGLLCPSCKGFVGFVSNLSGECPHCGAQILPLAGQRIRATLEVAE